MSQPPPWGTPAEEPFEAPGSSYTPYQPGQGYPPPAAPQAYGGYGHPAPYFGIDPMTGLALSEKSKVTAGLLQLLLPLIGIGGVGRLYAGHTAIGLVQLLGLIVSYVAICVFIGFIAVPAFLLWSLIDGIVMLASNNLRDGNGRIMR